MYNRLLVPLDGSSNAAEALNTAVSLAKDWHATITILHVIDIAQFTSRGLGAGYPEVVTSMRQNGRELMEKAKQVADNAGVHADMILKEGGPKQIITEIANDADLGIDLIVVGKSGTNAFSRLVIGSTTNYIVQHAEPNVFVVNDVPEEDDQ